MLPLIEEIIAASKGRMTAGDIFRLIAAGKAQLWVAETDRIRAVALTEFIRFPRRQICRVWACVGRGMDEWHPLIDEIEAWAKAEGCDAMRHEARKGWARVLAPKGYEMTHVILEKEL